MNIEELKAKAEAATDGPWAVPNANIFRVVAPKLRGPNEYPWAVIADDCRKEDAAFIAAANPAAVLELIRQRDELLALLKLAYGFTTASADLLPERIKAAIANAERQP